MAVLITSASVTGFLLGALRNGPQSFPKWTDGYNVAALLIAGLLAATYFIVVLTIGAGSADLMESAITPLILPIAAFLILKKCITKNAIIGGIIALAGFALVVFAPLKSEWMKDGIMLFVAYPLAGAVGSAFSLTFTRKLIVEKVGRFWCLGFKNLLAAFILVGLAVRKWQPDALSPFGFGVAAALGIAINAVILLAIYIQERARGGAVTLAVLYLFLPLTTAAGSRFLGLPDSLPTFSVPFMAGLVSILLGGGIAELWP